MIRWEPIPDSPQQRERLTLARHICEVWRLDDGWHWDVLGDGYEQGGPVETARAAKLAALVCVRDDQRDQLDVVTGLIREEREQ